ncbi:hypothetical protein [Brachybacterium avium]|uniref:hypothetical protein n=1 Tax=Brachybacterium avium TaxID=2017485 RepID=UPI001FE9A7BB|nr:hypothetical protein [Brachybacterium avium]
MPRATLRSGAADRTERSGQHRSWHSRLGQVLRGGGRAGASLLGAGLLLSGCTAAGQGSAPSPSDAGAAPSAAQETTDDASLSGACTAFWGDPEYVDPLSRTALAHAASAAEVGPSDPDFYAVTGDAIETAFEEAPAPAQETAGVLAEWFRTEPARGADADRDAFRSAWEGLAGSCQEISTAARWAVAPGEDGTKPASLVCADVFDTPGTLTHFANANVLTSNMFKLVGLYPRAVPAGREQDVQDTADLLTAEIAAVDDGTVRAALEEVRTPFLEVLEGDTWSEGLSEPLAELGTACEAVGYASPGVGEIDSEAVVGASAEDRHGTNHGGRS